MDPALHRAGTSAIRVQRICQELGLPALDLTPLLAADGEPERLFIPHDRHLSAAGCVAVATALAAWLPGVLPSLRR
jgi:hypothetical protein